MAIGDKVQGLVSTANAGLLNIQPIAGTEYVIHNISYGGAMELYFTDGTNSIKVDYDVSIGGMFGRSLHCTNGKYYAIKNVSGSAIYVGYDGVQTK